MAYDTNPPTRRPQVAEQCDELNGHVETLLKSIEELQQRLVPVLQSRGPEVASKDPTRPSSELVSHAAFLRDKNGLLLSAVNDLQSIISRLEI